MISLSSVRAIAFAGLFSVSALAQGTLTDYQRGQGLQTKARGLVVNLPATPTWEQVLDGDVDRTQGPATGAAQPPSTAPPRSLRGLQAAGSDPNNPFAAVNQPRGGTGTAANAPASGAPRLGVLQMIGDQSPVLGLRAAATVPTVPSAPKMISTSCEAVPSGRKTVRLDHISGLMLSGGRLV